MKISVFKTLSSACVVHNHRSRISLEDIVYFVVESQPSFLIGLHILKNAGMSMLLSGDYEILCSISQHITISTFLFCIFLESATALHQIIFSVSLCHIVVVFVGESTLRTLLAFSNLQYLTLSSCETLLP